MLAHYLSVALAKFAKAPFTTAANVLTLALGLACFIAAYGIANWWTSADGYHPDADRIVVVGASASRPGEARGPLNTSSNAVMAPYLAVDFPEIEPIARAMDEREVPVAAGDSKALFNVASVDPEFLQLFALEFVAGDAMRALDDPNAVVLTTDAAARLFGDAPALGRRLIVSGDAEAVVAGVIAPVRQPSFMGAGPEATLRFDMLRTWTARYGEADRATANSWLGFGPLTFAKLPLGLSPEALNARLPAFLEAHVPAEQQAAADFHAEAFPVSEIRTHELDESLFGGGFGVSAVGALIGLGALTVLVACVNYANLATAQAATRAKEIGMRRVLGAGRVQVMSQVWLEALLLTTVAVVAALAVLALAVPALRASMGVDPLFFLSQGLRPLAVVAALVVAVGLAAGAYPAAVLSRVQPAEALRAGRSRTGLRGMARLFVAIQFASASFLLILVTVTQLQREHLERTALAPRSDPILVLNDLMPLDVDYDTLAARLERLPGVRSVSVVDRGPWNLNGMNSATFARSVDAPAASIAEGYLKSIGYDYFETLNLELLAGRVFERGRDTAPMSPFGFPADVTQPYPVVLDEVYARRLGFATPEAAVGQIVYIPTVVTEATGRPAAPAEIIGVTAAETTRVEARRVSGVVYAYFPRAYFGGQHPLVRISPERVGETVAAITGVWDEFAPTIPINVRFFDDLFEASFATYARVSQLFMLLAGAAFVIASIGLLGMAVHVASRRRHEIGVRKTLGSTTLGVVRLLLIDFSKPVLAANLVAWPAAYLAAQSYLAVFAERVPLTPAPFALSMALTLAIAWAAVLGEVLKAASVRPADVLRHA